MMTYKGFVGVAHVDYEAGVIRGKVASIRDTITFQGKTVPEAEEAFRESVDDYLEFCESLGEAPDKPYSGTFVVRVDPELHRDVAALAEAKGESINRVVDSALKAATQRISDSAPMATRPAVAPGGQKSAAKPTRHAADIAYVGGKGKHSVSGKTYVPVKTYAPSLIPAAKKAPKATPGRGSSKGKIAK